MEISFWKPKGKVNFFFVIVIHVSYIDQMWFWFFDMILKRLPVVGNWCFGDLGCPMASYQERDERQASGLGNDVDGEMVTVPGYVCFRSW